MDYTELEHRMIESLCELALGLNEATGMRDKALGAGLKALRAKAIVNQIEVD